MLGVVEAVGGAVMTARPNVVRVTPKGPQTRPEVAIPVLVTLHRPEGGEFDTPASATAWTRDAVEVTWLAPSVGLVSDWVPACDVRRGKEAEKRLKQGGGTP
jgi:hypothetical protein